MPDEPSPSEADIDMADDIDDDMADDIELAVAEVQRRVAAGRVDGRYPIDLDRQLESEFSRLAKDPLWFRAFDALPGAVSRVRNAAFGHAPIEYSSTVPGGSALHRIVGKLVSRQVIALSQQMSTFASEVTRSLEDVVAALEETRTVVKGDVLGDIDAVHHRITAVETRLARLEAGHQPSADDPL